MQSDTDSTPPPNQTEVAPGIWLHHSILQFSFERSSGPGGQNVNKRSTKAVLRVDVEQLREVLTSIQLRRFRRLAESRINQQDQLLIDADQSRSQKQNRLDCIEQLGRLITQARRPVRKRKKTRPSVSSKRKRLDEKKRRSERKAKRRRPKPDDSR